jgi:glycopeptide antibiotics resistance protein
MRIVHIVKTKEKVILYKELLALLFVIYILCLFYVVTFQDVSWSTSNFIPFQEMLRYDFGSRLFIKNVLGNMLLFIPYGFFMAYYLKLKKPYSIFILSLIVSCTIEFTQLLIGRVFDVDDILLNLIGGMIGYLLFKLLEDIKDLLPSILKKPIIYNIIILILIVLMLLYLSNIITLGV